MRRKAWRVRDHWVAVHVLFVTPSYKAQSIEALMIGAVGVTASVTNNVVCIRVT